MSKTIIPGCKKPTDAPAIRPLLVHPHGRAVDEHFAADVVPPLPVHRLAVNFLRQGFHFFVVAAGNAQVRPLGMQAVGDGPGHAAAAKDHHIQL